MAKHHRNRTDEQRKRLTDNRQTMLEAISCQHDCKDPSTQSAGMTVILERFAVRGTDKAVVPYEGSPGMAQILGQLALTYPDGQIFSDGHLLGVQGRLGIDGLPGPIAVRATLGAGGQVVLAIGPIREIAHALDVVQVFDRQFHLACKAIGVECELVSQGCHPSARLASDVPIVPTARNALVNTYLARMGPSALDYLRCTAATVLRLPVADDEATATRRYQLCAAFAPIMAFLTDNSLRLHGCDPHETPRMARARLAHAADAQRCGLVPGSLGDGFGFEAYERWVEGIRPIVFASQDGVTFSTGADTCKRVMEERELTQGEALHLLGMAWPDVRWNGFLELACADSLQPRLACGYAALVKGLVASARSQERAGALIGLDSLDDDAILDAWDQLATRGWDARVYGKPAGSLVEGLALIARDGLENPGERRLLDELAQLWEVRIVPRDTLVANWDRMHPHTTRQEAAELYGEGAIIPYDELDGEPPAGQTAVIDLRQIQEALAQSDAQQD